MPTVCSLAGRKRIRNSGTFFFFPLSGCQLFGSHDFKRVTAPKSGLFLEHWTATEMTPRLSSPVWLPQLGEKRNKSSRLNHWHHMEPMASNVLSPWKPQSGCWGKAASKSGESRLWSQAGLAWGCGSPVVVTLAFPSFTDSWTHSRDAPMSIWEDGEKLRWGFRLNGSSFWSWLLSFWGYGESTLSFSRKKGLAHTVGETFQVRAPFKMGVRVTLT